MVSALDAVVLCVPAAFYAFDTLRNQPVLFGGCDSAILGSRSNAHDVQSMEGNAVMYKSVWASYVGSIAALGVATCCVLPMTMMLLGLGGSWLAVFGKIAAASFVVLSIASVILLAAWIVTYRRGALDHLIAWLVGSSILTTLAWVIVFNEARINDFLITLM
ncbi:hypothetical protein [Roseobacter ponti]|nr:hypothetical protein [Roseobacter ponti]